MSGMEKIVQTIRQEAEEKATGILRQSHERVAEIERTAAAKREEWDRRMTEQVKAERESVLARNESENRRIRKEALLKARSVLLESVIAQAKERIETLPDAEYFALMQRLFERNAQRGDGRLYFAKRDYDRIPEGFVEKLNGSLSDSSVELAGSTDKIAHGFVIVYGKIEQNCSIDSIFESEHSRIVDAANACLEKDA